ncbi:hypothetical protein SDC9_133001 [bioreactor metagenome]|uniref:Uncharacterized protein n=1 Tax=bioreactor metagenome TaxID=1076179 RepID=A0A645DA34_9ZZZZ
MNIFDAGGVTTFIAVVLTLIGGTFIFLLLHKLFDIIHFGFGAMISMWFICVVVAAFIVNILGGVAWFVIKLGAMIAMVVWIGKNIYYKIKGIDNEEN